MPKLTIDHREVEVPQGATVLEAARRLEIDIPALCFRQGCSPSTSCLVCLVRVGEDHRLVPSCATLAAEGMQVESETEEVYEVRRTALELLLSDHLGDCVAPCQFGCPAEMDIPTMLRQIAAGEFHEAIATVKRDIALPAVLGRICSGPCEKVCRRGDLDDAVSICLLKRLVADVDLASADPYVPNCLPVSGKQVAILGAGPTGLSAAYYLRRLGHACTLLDENPVPGGRLLTETTDRQLPREVLQAEIATITRLGIDLVMGQRIGPDRQLTDLRNRFDAVLLACGATGREQAAGWGLAVAQRGIQTAPWTFETGAPGVFAAGGAIRSKAIPIRSVADGKEAAIAIDQFLRGLPVTGPTEPFSTKIGRMEGDELARFAAGATRTPRQEPDSGLAAGFTAAEGARQAARCLYCDCRGATSCKLRKYAAQYNAHPRRFKAGRRVFQQDSQHAEVIYEPGKCIDCGLCIQIAAAAGEPLGLTFVGRGFDVRVAVPLDRSLAEALTKVAAECVAACPTAALAWKSS
jgi:NADPH-dependent glutamate synthase beta subunit-like oxidoreductase